MGPGSGPQDAAVRGAAGLVPVPGGDSGLGPAGRHADLVRRPGAARGGGAPTYLLTDNARTVTMDHVAGVPVRHPEMVALGRYYGCKVETCVPFDPESKGGSRQR